VTFAPPPSSATTWGDVPAPWYCSCTRTRYWRSSPSSWNLEWLWGYVLGAATLHLPLDIVFNGKVAGRNLVPFYSLVYRGRADFQTERLLDTRRRAAPPSRFWSAFFVGAVVTRSGSHDRADDPGRELFLADSA
jgi:hypothetical protein